MSPRFAVFDTKTEELICRTAHAGLVLDKFLDLDDPSWEKVIPLTTSDALYQRAYQRWERFWNNGSTTRVCWKAKVQGRLAIGLGVESPLEIGLRLHATYGRPLIPGSSIKGVLHSRALDQPYCKFLFGDTDQQGFLEFQDAWWIPSNRPAVALDVIAVHHPKYYAGQAPPTDFDDPTPVHFLSVIGSFLFVADAPNPSWRAFLEKLLQDVLHNDGIGAKRSAGYGRFSIER